MSFLWSLWWCSIVTIRQLKLVQSKYNVLFVVVDDLRAELGGHYGQSDIVSTPNFSSFMDNSFTFTHAYTQCAICAATRASFLTGTRPDTTRVWSIGPYFRDTMVNGRGRSVVTIPQYFKQNNYWTVGAGKIFHPGSASGGNSSCHPGDDVPFSWEGKYWHCGQSDTGKETSPVMNGCTGGTGCVQSQQCQQCLSSFHCFSNNTNGTQSAYCPANCDDSCYPDYAVASQTLEYFKQYINNDNARPFFIAAGLLKPHLGFYAPQKYYNMYNAQKTALSTHNKPPQDMPLIATNNCSEINNYVDVKPNITTMNYTWEGQMHKIALVTDDYSHYLRAAYYSAISFMDAQFGRIVQGLKDYNLWNNTIVVMTGDHGWSLGEQGQWTKHTNFEVTVRVPLLVRVPGVNEGKYSDVLVEQLDMFPTLLDLADIELDYNITQQLEGKSLKDIILNPKKPPSFPQYAYSQYVRYGGKAMGISLRTTEWRYTEWLGWDAGNNETGGNAVYPHPKWNDVYGIELYNHSNTTVDENDLNAYDNINLAYQQNMSDIVHELHEILYSTWDNQTWLDTYDSN
eukprot:139333_1